MIFFFFLYIYLVCEKNQLKKVMLEDCGFRGKSTVYQTGEILVRKTINLQ